MTSDYLATAICRKGTSATRPRLAISSDRTGVNVRSVPGDICGSPGHYTGRRSGNGDGRLANRDGGLGRVLGAGGIDASNAIGSSARERTYGHRASRSRSAGGEPPCCRAACRVRGRPGERCCLPAIDSVGMCSKVCVREWGWDASLISCIESVAGGAGHERKRATDLVCSAVVIHFEGVGTGSASRNRHARVCRKAEEAGGVSSVPCRVNEREDTEERSRDHTIVWKRQAKIDQIVVRTGRGPMKADVTSTAPCRKDAAVTRERSGGRAGDGNRAAGRPAGAYSAGVLRKGSHRVGPGCRPDMCYVFRSARVYVPGRRNPGIWHGATAEPVHAIAKLQIRRVGSRNGERCWLTDQYGRWTAQGGSIWRL